LVSFDPHSRRNCCRTGCENNTHQDDRAFHALPKSHNNGAM
jgi:hypothetical protein